MAASFLLREDGETVLNVQLDLSLNETFSFGNEITSLPVEGGSEISDHIRLQPVQIAVEGFITANPIIEAAESWQTEAEAQQRLANAIESLMDLRYNRLPVTIVCGLLALDDMVLLSLSIPRTPSTGDTVQFNSVWRQVFLAKTGTIQASYIAPAARAQAGPKQDQGQAAPKDAKKTTRASLIKSVFNHFGVTVSGSGQASNFPGNFGR